MVPPATGICHQVNLEYLATVVATRDGAAFPDTLVGTDSHTPMVNGLGVVGWGVGGIEAEAALLGQPISMLIPEVVGFKLSGELPEGTTATDLVLTVTNMLRAHGVVGRFVEFYGPGVANVPVENRATIGNMSPEYGSTITIFPVDDETLRYLRFTGRPDDLVALVEAYAKEQGLWHDPDAEPHLHRDARARPVDGRAVHRRARPPPGPRAAARGQDPLRRGAGRLAARRRGAGGHRGTAGDARPASARATTRPTPSRSRPATRPPPPGDGADPGPPAEPDGHAADAGDEGTGRPTSGCRCGRRHRSTAAVDVELDHGHVAIAAITSCTNTSNPQVMVAAGLLARKAVERGLARKPWVKTSLAPGSEGGGRLPRPGRACCPTSTSWASTSSASAAPPASATRARCADESPRPSTSTAWRWCRCCRATATSRAGSTPTSA